jgi:acyl dehydratase
MTATTRPSFDTVEVGDELSAVSYPIQRFDLVRYAGASGDFNFIHWNERFATSVGRAIQIHVGSICDVDRRFGFDDETGQLSFR